MSMQILGWSEPFVMMLAEVVRNGKDEQSSQRNQNNLAVKIAQNKEFDDNKQQKYQMDTACYECATGINRRRSEAAFLIPPWSDRQ